VCSPDSSEQLAHAHSPDHQQDARVKPGVSKGLSFAVVFGFGFGGVFLLFFN
jgi:hypothetical protein